MVRHITALRLMDVFDSHFNRQNEKSEWNGERPGEKRKSNI